MFHSLFLKILLKKKKALFVMLVILSQKCFDWHCNRKRIKYDTIIKAIISKTFPEDGGLSSYHSTSLKFLKSHLPPLSILQD